MTIEPVSEKCYLARVGTRSFQVYVKPDSPWHVIAAAAREKLQALRLRAAVIDTGTIVEIRDSLTDSLGTTVYAVIAGTTHHGIWHESELDFC